MKRALVLSLLVVIGLGFASAAQLQGEWDSYLKLDLSEQPALTLAGFYSFLDIQYLVGGWTLEAATVVTGAGLSNVWFEAYGSLGAFSAWSLVAFDPTTPAFTTFENGAEVSIAGVDIYALFALQAVGEGWGSGFALGGIGTAGDTAGDIRIGAEVTWNLYPNLWSVFLYGLNGAVTDWTYTAGCDIWSPEWYVGALEVIQSGCDVVFSYITGIAQFPICCADVYVGVEFSCTGFDCLAFLAKNIDIGIDWLKIYELGINYAVDAKTIGFAFQVVTGDVVCFKPYFDVVMGETQNVLDGISLDALTLSCTLGGCEFFWGHIFDHNMTYYSGSQWPASCIVGRGPYQDDYYFNAVGGGISRSWGQNCSFRVLDDEIEAWVYPNEVFGVQCDEDSCCGGLFSFSVNNFFLTDSEEGQTGIFGWLGTYIELSAGIGSNVNVVGGLKVSNLNGTEFVTIGINVAW